MKKYFSFLFFVVLFCCNAYAGVWVTTQNGQQIYFTPNSQQSFGYEGSVVISNNISGDLIIPEYVTLSNGITYTVTRIQARGPYTVTANTGLTTVTIPSTIKYIEDRAFHKCTGLTTVYFNALDCNQNGVATGVGAFDSCFNFTTLYIGDNVNRIPGGPFKECHTLTTIHFADSGRTHFIMARAFQGCVGLDSVAIPNTVHTIGESAFENCDGLTSIVIPSSVTTIGNNAFQHCDGLASVTIHDVPTPASTDYTLNIGYYAFTYCDNLRTINYNATYSNYTCLDCYSSSTPYGGIFYGCDSLDITIGNNVRHIPPYAFYRCNIDSLTIGYSVTGLGSYAFGNCNVFPITSLSTVAPLISVSPTAFDGVNTAFMRVHIPCGSLSSYNSRWSASFYFVETQMHSFDIQTLDSTMGSVTIFSQYGCSTPMAIFSASADSGYYFSHWSDGSTDNPRSLVVTQDTTIVAFFEQTIPDTLYIDTLYINVPYPVHDTTIVHDTAYVPYPVHDTTYVDVPYPVHDTTYVDVPYPIHDTTIVHDTTYVDIPYPVHDTTYIDVPYPVHDTMVVADTIWLTLYDTVWLHDTIVVHDTIYITQEGVDGAEAVNAKVYASQGQIVVEGAKGNTVTLYDVTGRVLATKQDDYAPLHFDVRASGTYMIKIGLYPARKVVVIR